MCDLSQLLPRLTHFLLETTSLNYLLLEWASLTFATRSEWFFVRLQESHLSGLSSHNFSKNTDISSESSSRRHWLFFLASFDTSQLPLWTSLKRAKPIEEGRKEERKDGVERGWNWAQINSLTGRSFFLFDFSNFWEGRTEKDRKRGKRETFIV